MTTDNSGVCLGILCVCGARRGGRVTAKPPPPHELTTPIDSQRVPIDIGRVGNAVIGTYKTARHGHGQHDTTRHGTVRHGTARTGTGPCERRLVVRYLHREAEQ